MFSINTYYYINVREYRRGNQKGQSRETGSVYRGIHDEGKQNNNTVTIQ